MTGDRHPNGHRWPWGRECPGWPWCYTSADELAAAAAEYEAVAAQDVGLTHLADVAGEIRDELERRT